MITVTFTYKRPDVNVPYWNIVIAEQIDKTKWYMDSGKINISVNNVDELTQIKTTTFVDQNTYDEYMNDPIIIAKLSARDEYHNANGITMTTQIS